MTPRDALLVNLRREGMPTVPFDINLSPYQQSVFREKTGAASPYEWFGLLHRGLFDNPVASSNGSESPSASLPAGTTIDPWGVAHVPGSAEAYHMKRLVSPLAGDVPLSTIESHPMPTTRSASELAPIVQEIHDHGFASMGVMSQTIWETAWAIRSMEDLMVDMATDDDRATALLNKITDIAVIRARAYALAGCDIVHLGDDIGMQRTPMMSVEMWRKWLKPRLAQVIDAVREVSTSTLIFYHSCGYVEPFIDELLEIGIQILNPVQPESMSFESLHTRFGDRLSFWGTIGTQTTMPFGTPEEVRRAVFQNVKRCTPRGGLVIGPTHMVEPEVPWANIVAAHEACQEAIPAPPLDSVGWDQ